LTWDLEKELLDFEKTFSTPNDSLEKDFYRLKMIHFHCSIRAVQTQYDLIDFMKENWVKLQVIIFLI
jgi:hypothetical protein